MFWGADVVSGSKGYTYTPPQGHVLTLATAAVKSRKNAAGLGLRVDVSTTDHEGAAKTFALAHLGGKSPESQSLTLFFGWHKPTTFQVVVVGAKDGSAVASVSLTGYLTPTEDSTGGGEETDGVFASMLSSDSEDEDYKPLVNGVVGSGSGSDSDSDSEAADAVAKASKPFKVFGKEKKAPSKTPVKLGGAAAPATPAAAPTPGSAKRDPPSATPASASAPSSKKRRKKGNKKKRQSGGPTVVQGF